MHAGPRPGPKWDSAPCATRAPNVTQPPQKRGWGCLEQDRRGWPGRGAGDTGTDVPFSASRSLQRLFSDLVHRAWPSGPGRSTLADAPTGEEVGSRLSYEYEIRTCLRFSLMHDYGDTSVVAQRVPKA